MSLDHRAFMKTIFDNLFKNESPRTAGPGAEPEPAFDAQVQFRSGYAIQGTVARNVLETEDFVSAGTLKMACPSMVYDPQYPNNPRFARKIIAEHYFDYEDVESVIVIRQVDASKIAGDGKPSIILGG